MNARTTSLPWEEKKQRKEQELKTLKFDLQNQMNSLREDLQAEFAKAHDLRETQNAVSELRDEISDVEDTSVSHSDLKSYAKKEDQESLRGDLKNLEKKTTNTFDELSQLLDKKFEAIQKLEERCESLSHRLHESDDSEVEDLKGKITSALSLIEDLRADITTYEGRFGEVDNRVENETKRVNAEFDTMKKQVEEAYDDLEDRTATGFEKVEEEIEELKSSLNKLSESSNSNESSEELKRLRELVGENWEESIEMRDEIRNRFNGKTEKLENDIADIKAAHDFNVVELSKSNERLRKALTLAIEAVQEGLQENREGTSEVWNDTKAIRDDLQRQIKNLTNEMKEMETASNNLHTTASSRRDNIDVRIQDLKRSAQLGRDVLESRLKLVESFLTKNFDESIDGRLIVKSRALTIKSREIDVEERGGSEYYKISEVVSEMHRRLEKMEKMYLNPPALQVVDKKGKNFVIPRDSISEVRCVPVMKKRRTATAETKSTINAFVLAMVLNSLGAHFALKHAGFTMAAVGIASVVFWLLAARNWIFQVDKSVEIKYWKVRVRADKKTRTYKVDNENICDVLSDLGYEDPEGFIAGELAKA
jgi:chromosome segregation ATPase